MERGKGRRRRKKKVKIVQEQVDVTIAKDSKVLIEKIAEARGLNLESLKSRVVIDGGQGSLKVVVSIFDEDVDPEVSFASQEGYKEKLTGSNRLIFLAEVEGGQERHANL